MCKLMISIAKAVVLLYIFVVHHVGLPQLCRPDMTAVLNTKYDGNFSEYYFLITLLYER